MVLVAAARLAEPAGEDEDDGTAPPGDPDGTFTDKGSAPALAVGEACTSCSVPVIDEMARRSRSRTDVGIGIGVGYPRLQCVMVSSEGA